MKYNGYYEGCPECIRPFWISREPVTWPWCNMAASQRRPYCASVNSHSPVGLDSRQWDAIDWACALCDLRIHKDRRNRSANLHRCACPSYSCHAGFFGKTSLTQFCQPPYSHILLPVTSGFYQSGNRLWKWGDLWMRLSHSTQAQSAASHCRLTSPTEELLFTVTQ
jgi:hypothetical protein